MISTLDSQSSSTQQFKGPLPGLYCACTSARRKTLTKKATWTATYKMIANKQKLYWMIELPFSVFFFSFHLCCCRCLFMSENYSDLESSVFCQMLRVNFLIMFCSVLACHWCQQKQLLIQFFWFVPGRSGYSIYDGTTNEAKKNRNYRCSLNYAMLGKIKRFYHGKLSWVTFPWHLLHFTLGGE